MARNLVQEKETKTEAVAEVKVDATKPTEEKVIYMTTEQVTLNNLNVIMAQLDIMYTKMIEGFKQVGVKFEETKA